MYSVTIFGQLAWHWQIQCGNWSFSNVYLDAINYFNGQQNVNLRKLDSVTGSIWNYFSYLIFILELRHTLNFDNDITTYANIFENKMNIPFCLEIISIFISNFFHFPSNLHLNKIAICFKCFQTNIFFSSSRSHFPSDFSE